MPPRKRRLRRSPSPSSRPWPNNSRDRDDRSRPGVRGRAWPRPVPGPEGPAHHRSFSEFSEFSGRILRAEPAVIPRPPALPRAGRGSGRPRRSPGRAPDGPARGCPPAASAGSRPGKRPPPRAGRPWRSGFPRGIPRHVHGELVSARRAGHVGFGVPFVSWVALGWGEPFYPWWGPVGFIGRPCWWGWGGPHWGNNWNNNWNHGGNNWGNHGGGNWSNRIRCFSCSQR